jgi:hypothetical protein
MVGENDLVENHARSHSGGMKRKRGGRRRRKRRRNKGTEQMQPRELTGDNNKLSGGVIHFGQ